MVPLSPLNLGIPPITVGKLQHLFYFVPSLLKILCQRFVDGTAAEVSAGPEADIYMNLLRWRDGRESQ